MISQQLLLSSGVPGFDAMLAGGISRNALVLLIGAPGAGKTVLSSQILFNAARQGLQTLVFTSYSEGNEQYLEHMRGFQFFDRDLVGKQVTIFTLQSQLADTSVLPSAALMRTIRETGAKVVLLDGMQSFSTTENARQSLRDLLGALATQIRYLDATLLVTLAGDARDSKLWNELTVADAALGLKYWLDGARHRREIEVVKLRGRAQLPGLHSYTLSDAGVSVFLRVEVYPQPHDVQNPAGRAAFNLPEFDQLLGGGPTIGSSTLIAGAPSTGKTTLALHWALTDARPEATTLFVTFGEHDAQLVQKAQAFGLNLAAAIASGAVHVIRIPPVELDPNQVSDLVLRALDQYPVQRLVIDDILALTQELGLRTRPYLAALNAVLAGRGITSLYLLEIRPFSGFNVDFEQNTVVMLSDNMIVLQQYEAAGGLRRLLAVLRMRFSAYDRTLRELVLDEGGVRVLRPDESASGVLSESARLGAGVAPEQRQKA